MLFTRIAAAAGALAVMAVTLTTVSPPSATADPASQCDQVRVIGAAGSGELDDTGARNRTLGLGKFGIGTFNNLRDDVAKAGYAESVSSEFVIYRAHRVPESIAEVAPFLQSIREGQDLAYYQVQKYLTACGSKAKVVIFGYSQGAIIMNSVLKRLGADSRIFGSVLVADGYRVSGDTVKHLGTARNDWGGGSGIVVASRGALKAKFNTDAGKKIISVCNSKDPVCDTFDDPRAATRIIENNVQTNVHDSYDAQTWRRDLFSLVSPHLTKKTTPARAVPAAADQPAVKSMVGTWQGRSSIPRLSTLSMRLDVRSDTPFTATFTARGQGGYYCSSVFNEVVRVSDNTRIIKIDNSSARGDCASPGLETDTLIYDAPNTLRISGQFTFTRS